MAVDLKRVFLELDLEEAKCFRASELIQRMAEADAAQCLPMVLDRLVNFPSSHALGIHVLHELLRIHPFVLVHGVGPATVYDMFSPGTDDNAGAAFLHSLLSFKDSQGMTARPETEKLQKLLLRRAKQQDLRRVPASPLRAWLCQIWLDVLSAQPDLQLMAECCARWVADSRAPLPEKLPCLGIVGRELDRRGRPEGDIWLAGLLLEQVCRDPTGHSPDLQHMLWPLGSALGSAALKPLLSDMAQERGRLVTLWSCLVLWSPQAPPMDCSIPQWPLGVPPPIHALLLAVFEALSQLPAADELCCTCLLVLVMVVGSGGPGNVVATSAADLLCLLHCDGPKLPADTWRRVATVLESILPRPSSKLAELVTRIHGELVRSDVPAHGNLLRGGGIVGGSASEVPNGGGWQKPYSTNRAAHHDPIACGHAEAGSVCSMMPTDAGCIGQRAMTSPDLWTSDCSGSTRPDGSAGRQVAATRFTEVPRGTAAIHTGPGETSCLGGMSNPSGAAGCESHIGIGGTTYPRGSEGPALGYPVGGSGGAAPYRAMGLECSTGSGAVNAAGRPSEGLQVARPSVPMHAPVPADHFSPFGPPDPSASVAPSAFAPFVDPLRPHGQVGAEDLGGATRLHGQLGVGGLMGLTAPTSACGPTGMLYPPSICGPLGPGGGSPDPGGLVGHGGLTGLGGEQNSSIAPRSVMGPEGIMGLDSTVLANGGSWGTACPAGPTSGPSFNQHFGAMPTVPICASGATLPPVVDGIPVAYFGVRVGLQNTNNTCYMNTFIQALFNTSSFLRRVFTFALTLKKKPSKVDEEDFEFGVRLVEILQKQMAKMALTRHSHTDIWELLQVFPDVYRSGEQQDVTETIRFVFDKLGSFEQPLVREVFAGELSELVQCQVCGTIRRKPETFSDLVLSVPKEADVTASQVMPTIQQLMNERLKVENLDEDNLLFCEACQANQRARKWCEIVSPPAHLCLCLNRFTFDVNTMGFTKEKTPVCVDGLLQIGPFTYELYMAIVHTGVDASSGHYYAIGRRSEATDGPNDWVTMDDSQVKPADMSVLTGRAVTKKNDNPYALFYRCQQAPPTPSLLVPQKLAKLVEKEDSARGE